MPKDLASAASALEEAQAHLKPVQDKIRVYAVYQDGLSENAPAIGWEKLTSDKLYSRAVEDLLDAQNALESATEKIQEALTAEVLNE